jgi:hypothetical protein
VGSPRRLLLEQQPLENPPEGFPDSPPLDAPIIEEFTLSERDGVTTLRLHNAGIPDSGDWDGYYDGTNVGWDGYFQVLRHYLERHPGRTRHTITPTTPLGDGVDAQAAWERITGPRGLAIGAVTGGDTVDSTAATGERIAGEVMAASPPSSLLLNVASMDDTLLGMMIAPGAGGEPGWATLSLWRYGADPDEVKGQYARWQAWLTELLA